MKRIKKLTAAQTEAGPLTDLVVCSVIVSYINVIVTGASALQFHRHERLIPPAA